MLKAKLSTTTAILVCAILVILVVMACPNTPWDSGDPTRELERMHAGILNEDTQGAVDRTVLNLIVRQADGYPAPNVRFRICEPVRNSHGARALFEGVTGAEGRCITTIRLPAAMQSLAIEWGAPRAANEAGRAGPAYWKHSSRMLVQRHELGALELSLARP